MVTIRLARGGANKQPFYSVVVADQRRAPGSRFIERLGFYNPVARGSAEKLRLDVDRIQHWIDLGAQPSPRVTKLVKGYTPVIEAPAPVPAPAAAAAETPAAASE